MLHFQLRAAEWRAVKMASCCDDLASATPLAKLEAMYGTARAWAP